MAKGNWEANPPAQNDAGEVNQSRGMEGDANVNAPQRKTGKVGTPTEKPNTTIPSEMQPSGKPRL